MTQGSDPQDSAIRREVLDANAAYAADFGDKGGLALPPARGFAILTCMDARLDPARYAGLAEGDAHVIRNAGGRASDDAIRSLIISHKLLGTNEWFVIHHTDCGMELFDGPTMATLLETSRATAQYSEGRWRNVDEEGGSPEGWHRLAELHRSCPERARRCRPDPQPSADAGRDTGARLHLRRADGQAAAGVTTTGWPQGPSPIGGIGAGPG